MASTEPTRCKQILDQKFAQGVRAASAVVVSTAALRAVSAAAAALRWRLILVLSL